MSEPSFLLIAFMLDLKVFLLELGVIGITSHFDPVSAHAAVSELGKKSFDRALLSTNLDFGC